MKWEDLGSVKKNEIVSIVKKFPLELDECNYSFRKWVPPTDGSQKEPVVPTVPIEMMVGESEEECNSKRERIQAIMELLSKHKIESFRVDSSEIPTQDH